MRTKLQGAKDDVNAKFEAHTLFAFTWVIVGSAFTWAFDPLFGVVALGIGIGWGLVAAVRFWR